MQTCRVRGRRRAHTTLACVCTVNSAHASEHLTRGGRVFTSSIFRQLPRVERYRAPHLPTQHQHQRSAVSVLQCACAGDRVWAHPWCSETRLRPSARARLSPPIAIFRASSDDTNAGRRRRGEAARWRTASCCCSVLCTNSRCLGDAGCGGVSVQGAGSQRAGCGVRVGKAFVHGSIVAHGPRYEMKLRSQNTCPFASGRSASAGTPPHTHTAKAPPLSPRVCALRPSAVHVLHIAPLGTTTRVHLPPRATNGGKKAGAAHH